MRLLDSHCHLADPDFADDLDEVLARARAVGVSRFICNASHEGSWTAVAAIPAAHDGVIPAFGIHPWFAEKAGEDWQTRLHEQLKTMPSAIGECGLDRVREPRNEALQEQVFRDHIAISRDTGLPLSIHGARAWNWLLSVLTDEAPLPPFLLHSYGGGAEMIPAFAKLGGNFSFSANILKPDNKKGRAALVHAPTDRLHIETDSPDLPPPGFSPRNEPANLPLVLAEAARLLGLPEDDLADRLQTNARALWGNLLD